MAEVRQHPRLGRFWSTGLVLLVLAGTAAAQLGVQRPAVQKRIFAMKDMADNTKLLGHMAKGKRAFDAAMAQRAVDEIAAGAGRIPGLFKAFEIEAGSDARPQIWSNYPDFVARAGVLERTASAVSIRSQTDLTAALNAIGSACSGCHKVYRK